MRKLIILFCLVPLAAFGGRLIVDGADRGSYDSVTVTSNGDVKVTLSGGTGPAPDPEPEPDPDPGSCVGGATPDGFAADTSRFTSFPGTQGTTEEFTIRSGRYRAIQFTPTGDVGDFGKMHFISHTHAPNGSLLAVISECPGDFRPLDGASLCRKGPGGTMGFFWSIENVEFTCQLQQGQTYYLNLVYAKGQGNNLVNTCEFSRCGHLMQWDNY